MFPIIESSLSLLAADAQHSRKVDTLADFCEKCQGIEVSTYNFMSEYTKFYFGVSVLLGKMVWILWSS